MRVRRRWNTRAAFAAALAVLLALVLAIATRTVRRLLGR